jgi:FkbM family methyltransferase
MTFYSQVA